MAALLNACASVPSGQDRVARVDQYVAQEEYHKARQLLGDIDARDPHFDALLKRRRALNALVTLYENTTRERVEALRARGEWVKAAAVLSEALGRLPDSQSLSALQRQFRQARERRLATLDYRATLSEAEYLIEKSRYLQRAEQVHGGGLAHNWQRFWLERRSRELAGELMHCGRDAFANSQLDLAESCFSMAHTLGTDQDVIAYLAVVDQQRLAKRRQALLKQYEDRESSPSPPPAPEAADTTTPPDLLADLKSRYRQLFQAGWWRAARETLRELQLLVPEDPQVVDWKEELETAIQGEVAEGIRQGQSLYSRGHLYEALAVWREAASLDPENPTLQEHIERAERFIDKLNRLDQKSEG